MFILKDKTSGSFSVSCNASQDAVAEIKAPVIEENGIMTSLTKTENGRYVGNGFEGKDTVSDLGKRLFSVERTVINTGEKRTFKLITEAETSFAPNRYLIPCVSYNGNEYGNGKEPKGMFCDGQPWIHAYDRESIPSCTITENKETAFAIFVSDRDSVSLRSSCSIIPSPKDGEYIQRIYWPVTEAPYTYSDNDKFTERYDEYITLENGENFTVLFYVFASVPRWENYGSNELFDIALDLFDNNTKPHHSADELWDLAIKYARFLLHPIPDKSARIFKSGTNSTPSGIKYSRHSEIGWIGQNILNARMLIRNYMKNGDEKCLQEAIEACDTWIQKQFDNGLILARYEWYTNGREWNYIPFDPNSSWAANYPRQHGWPPETCNTGWAAMEFLRIWALLQSIGIDKPQYKEFAVKICDFFCERYSDEYAFGKTWHHETGECLDKTGSIGGFITMALIEAYKTLGEKRYFEVALRSLDFYFERDLNNLICTAGAIDCVCVDKETAGPFITASIDAYEITKNPKYLEYAEKAAYYFNTWMFVYEPLYGPEAEFTEYGYSVAGGTAVSVQHPAIDQWGEYVCSDYYRLFKLTGDKRWFKRMLMIWFNSTQCITVSEGQLIHGRQRPIGSQSEAFFHCRWGHRADCNERGHMTDWLPSWVNAFRLYTMDRLINVCGAKDIDFLNSNI